MDYAAKLHDLFKIVTQTGDMRARSELFKMYQNCKRIYIQLDTAQIECRKRGKKTTEYETIEQNLNESIKEFERWITFAGLLYS